MSDLTTVASPTAEPEADRLGRVRLWAALAWALTVDLLQTPASVAWLTGVGGPLEWVLNEGLDLVTMVVLTALVGFHWSFLPAFVVESIPFVDVAPTWTGSVLFAKRKELRVAISRVRGTST